MSRKEYLKTALSEFQKSEWRRTVSEEDFRRKLGAILPDMEISEPVFILFTNFDNDITDVLYYFIKYISAVVADSDIHIPKFEKNDSEYYRNIKNIYDAALINNSPKEEFFSLASCGINKLNN